MAKSSAASLTRHRNVGDGLAASISLDCQTRDAAGQQQIETKGRPLYKRTKMMVLAGAAATVVGSAGSPAMADPPSGVVPAHTNIVGVGSDTTQLVVDKFSIDFNATHTSPKVYSWDAVGTATITTKVGCAAITRPNGSGAGITALKANARPSGDTADFCVDFARSSRGPQAGDGTAIAFVAYAKDAVTWSANATTNATASLTTLQLRAIYSCNAALLGTGKTGKVTWNEVGGTSTAAVVPVIPQSSSGTRSFFLGKIGVTTLGSCVVPTNNSVEENEGTNAIFKSASAVNEIFPYSVAVYLAQTVHGHGAGTQGNLKLHSVNGVAPTTGTGSATKINPAFPYSRSVYNVVRDNGTTSHVPTYLRTLLGAGNDTGWICTNATAQADIASYGFLSLGTNCGTVSKASS